MSDLSPLINEGVLAINKPKAVAQEKTVIVLGAARGGTTMVASVLQALGVSMGDKLGPVLEDVALSEAVEARNKTLFLKLVSKRNNQYAVWGWKRPAAIDFDDVWQGGFRNPYIIAVFRDPFAIANRNRISMLSDVFQNMEQSVQHLAKLVKFLSQQTCPILLCSYEKALVAPDTFVRAVNEFLDLNASQQLGRAVKCVSPASSAYLENSRITHSKGHLDIANREVCSGWAFFPKLTTRAATVHILLNDQLVYSVIAQEMRQDLKLKGIHPTGLCGFKFKWPADLVLNAGDKIQAIVDGDTKQLVGSPKIIAGK